MSYRNGKFFLGFVIGAAAGLAAKLLYDNKEEVYVFVGDKAKVAKEEISDFVEYASDRMQVVGEGVEKKTSEIFGIAKEKISGLKASIKGESEDDEETDESEE